MVVNMTTEFNLSYLYLLFNRWYDESINTSALLINILLPFVFLYIPIAVIKKYLSITAFYREERKKIFEFKKENPGLYLEEKESENSRKKEFKDNLESRIKGFTLKMEKNSDIIFYMELSFYVLIVFIPLLSSIFINIHSKTL